MPQDKKLVTEITPRDEDFGRWYTDVVLKSGLVDYSGVKGCVIMRPYATALWENIRSLLDARFKATGHENVMMPLFIPESLLNLEKSHIAGFAPEVAWITHGGGEKLAERLCVRPTSETLFCEHYKNIVHSYRDLPQLLNQWCSVVRWEKSTRPFLRSREFWWQEGHTLHATPEEANGEVMRMLDIYADFAERDLAMPVVRGRKSESEKFAGAEATYSIECMMHDGRALQSATSHYLGDGFARAFGIQFTDRDNLLKTPFQTSWGMSTRIIGGIIMTHGDDAGLVLPPNVAPVQCVVIPIASHKEGVTEAAQALTAALNSSGVRAKIDLTDNTPGWKFAEHEMRGVPLRIELGPRDLEKGECVLVRRTTREKSTIAIESAPALLPGVLEDIQRELYDEARRNRDAHTSEARGVQEIRDILSSKGGFIHAQWCGGPGCEQSLKDELGLTTRNMPFDLGRIADKCVCCGKQADIPALWALAY